MMYFLPSVVLFVLGIAGGILGGMLGVGGAIVLVPVFSYYLHLWGLPDAEIVRGTLASSLSVVVFAGLSASYKQAKIGNFYLRQSLAAALPGAVSTLCFAWLISCSDWYSRERFTGLFLGVLGLVAVRLFLQKKDAVAERQIASIPLWKFSMIGFGAGIFTALSGLGGGIIMTPLFSTILKVDIKKAISLSSGAIPFLGLANMGWYMVHTPAVLPATFTVPHIGYVMLPLVLPAIVGVLVGAPLGVRISTHITPGRVKIFFLFFIFVLALKMLWDLPK